MHLLIGMNYNLDRDKNCIYIYVKEIENPIFCFYGGFLLSNLLMFF